MNFSEKTIIFRRNNDKFTINFSTIAGDQLYPCALFYYLNDEIEFLPNHKFWCDLSVKIKLHMTMSLSLSYSINKCTKSMSSSIKIDTKSFSILPWAHPHSFHPHNRTNKPILRPRSLSIDPSNDMPPPSLGHSPEEKGISTLLMLKKQLPHLVKSHCCPTIDGIDLTIRGKRPKNVVFLNLSQKSIIFRWWDLIAQIESKKLT